MVVTLVPEVAVSLRLTEELANAIESSVTSSTLMLIVFEVLFAPSLAVKVREYEVAVS